MSTRLCCCSCPCSYVCFAPLSIVTRTMSTVYWEQWRAYIFHAVGSSACTPHFLGLDSTEKGNAWAHPHPHEGPFYSLCHEFVCNSTKCRMLNMPWRAGMGMGEQERPTCMSSCADRCANMRYKETNVWTYVALASSNVLRALGVWALHMFETPSTLTMAAQHANGSVRSMLRPSIESKIGQQEQPFSR